MFKNRVLQKLFMFLGIALILIGGLLTWHNYTLYLQSQKTIYINTKINLLGFYSNQNDEVPVTNITESDVTKLEKNANKITDKDLKNDKKELKAKIKSLKSYVTVKDDLNSYLTNGILNSNTTSADITRLNNEYSTLERSYQLPLQDTMVNIISQYNNITNVDKQIANLFTDTNRTIVKDNVTRNDYNSAINNLTSIKENDIVTKETNYLTTINNELNRREEAERQRLAEEKRKKIAAIAAAWKELKVPYISQNQNNVLNGCEAASLLMGLQYKGYLKDTTLATFAENMPKSTDPFKGFTYDIYTLEPTDVPHWIAPAPLAAYGISSSGDTNIRDATGSSLDDLDKEVANNNPVVIYLTGNFKTPKAYIEGAPKNVHVLLLTGYNSITGDQIIIDPWTHTDGTTRWVLTKTLVESIYNSTDKRAVVIG